LKQDQEKRVDFKHPTRGRIKVGRGKGLGLERKGKGLGPILVKQKKKEDR